MLARGVRGVLGASAGVPGATGAPGATGGGVFPRILNLMRVTGVLGAGNGVAPVLEAVGVIGALGVGGRVLGVSGATDDAGVPGPPPSLSFHFLHDCHPLLKGWATGCEYILTSSIFEQQYFKYLSSHI